MHDAATSDSVAAAHQFRWLGVDLQNQTNVRLSTGKAWRVDAEPGYVLQDATWTFDDTWLYYGETMGAANDVHKLYRIRRLKLTQLDAWGKPL